jgi:hypothetical protein
MTKNRRDFRNRLVILLAGLTTILALFAWLAWSEPFVFRWLLRLYTDREFMHQILQRYGVLAPLVFIVIQALQVIIAPIPGDVTGVLGGFAFGQWLGFFYSTIGLTCPSPKPHPTQWTTADALATDSGTLEETVDRRGGQQCGSVGPPPQHAGPFGGGGGAQPNGRTSPIVANPLELDQAARRM